MKFNRFDDFRQIIRDLDRPIGIGGVLDSSAPQFLFKEGPIICVIGHSGIRVFEHVAGQDTDYCFPLLDRSLCHEATQPRYTSGTSGFTS